MITNSFEIYNLPENILIPKRCPGEDPLFLVVPPAFFVAVRICPKLPVIAVGCVGEIFEMNSTMSLTRETRGHRSPRGCSGTFCH